MAYEYGSTNLGIRNPFRIEGTIRAIRGCALVLIGVYSMFLVRSFAESGEHVSGWFYFILGLAVLLHGLTVASYGIMQVTRFFVGRGVPTSLAKNMAKSEAHLDEPNVVYSPQNLEHMLQGRKNISISEPVGWFARLTHSVFPKLIFLPYVYRNIAQQSGQSLAQCLFGVLCFSLAWFSGASGLTTLHETAVLDWLAFGLVFYFLAVWTKGNGPLSRDLQREPDAIGLPTIAIWLSISILLPFLLYAVNQYVVTLQPLTLPVGQYLFVVVILGCLTVTGTFVLLWQRAKLVNPRTEVAELRDNWQESIHPQEIFINFENIVMANRRYKEVPNRVYREYDARLSEEGSDDKGQFFGETIQETQPVYTPLKHSKIFLHTRLALTIVGHFALFWAIASLYQNAEQMMGILQDDGIALIDKLSQMFSACLFAAIIWIFGATMSKIAHGFWAEMCFESLMVFFQCQGTFTESRVSTGTSIYDSLRSENVLVRSSMTPWLLVSRFMTSCIAQSGSENLEQPRYILEFHSAEEQLNQIVTEIHGFLDNRETIASVKNRKDLTSSAEIAQVNAASREAGAEQQQQQQKSIEGYANLEYYGVTIDHDHEHESPPGHEASQKESPKDESQN